MKKVRQEDLQMKIPALLHLSRLGYGYLSREEVRRRDRKTNIFPEALRTAAERINGLRLTAEQAVRLLADLQAQLEAEDLGRQFYRTLRDGWNGLRLIDFEHPGNNLFQSAAELACGTGAGSFRPDITLFVNGLPLAMIEVKAGNRPQGLRAEYHRMTERLRSREGRSFLQGAQIWAFSDDHGEDPARLLPTEGTFYTSAMRSDFPVFLAGEKRSGAYSGLLPRNPEAESGILADNGMQELPRTRVFRKSLSPEKSTHRMLTALFQPERFLFFLRYGVQYIRETDEAGDLSLTRRILTTEQLAGLNALKQKAKRGYRNWTLPYGGAAGREAANASLIALLRDLIPGARLYWISEGDRELFRDQAAFQACEIPCAGQFYAKPGQLILLTAESDPETALRDASEQGFTGRRVFILPQSAPRYEQKTGLSAGLRKADPEAVLITRITEPQARL